MTSGSRSGSRRSSVEREERGLEDKIDLSYLDNVMAGGNMYFYLLPLTLSMQGQRSFFITYLQKAALKL
jgi:hypothetical protein